MILKKLPTGVQDILPRECRALGDVREKLTRAFEGRGVRTRIVRRSRVL